VSRHCERDDSSDEVEITQEMLDAGALALSEYDSRFESDFDAVRRIFLVMKRLESDPG
jgi:hypothetical protein